MVRYRDTDTDGVQRLLNRKPARTRVSGRHRSKKKGTALTSLQKAQLQIERRERTRALNDAVNDARDHVWNAAKKMHEEFQSHSAEYFQQLIMQTSRIKSRQRKTSRWNAFLSKELHTRNADVSDGSERARVADGEVTREIADKWHAMSKKDKEAATDDTLKELEERHENFKKGTHTVPIQAFHDTRKTLGTIQREIEDLNMRTGTEILMFAVRSETSSFTQPFAFYTNDRLKDFIRFATGDTPEHLAVRLEGYCVSGMKGVAYNYVQGLLNLKKDVAVLITSKLKEACQARGLVNRMCYVNFDDKITARYGVVIENWPLTKFCAPGDIGSRPELDTLLGAWRDGRARFRSMDDAEWTVWLDKRSANPSGSGDNSGGDAGSVTDTAGTPLTDATPPAIASATPATTASTTPAASFETTAAITAAVPATASAAATADPATTSAAAATAATTISVAAPTATTAIPAGPAVAPTAATAVSAAATAAATTAPCAPRKRARGEVSFIAVNVITGEDGRSVTMGKRSRKPRKGKSSGDNATMSNTPSAVTADASGSPADAGPRKKKAKGKGSKKT